MGLSVYNYGTLIITGNTTVSAPSASIASNASGSGLLRVSGSSAHLTLSNDHNLANYTSATGTGATTINKTGSLSHNSGTLDIKGPLIVQDDFNVTVGDLSLRSHVTIDAAFSSLNVAQLTLGRGKIRQQSRKPSSVTALGVQLPHPPLHLLTMKHESLRSAAYTCQRRRSFVFSLACSSTGRAPGC